MRFTSGLFALASASIAMAQGGNMTSSALTSSEISTTTISTDEPVTPTSSGAISTPGGGNSTTVPATSASQTGTGTATGTSSSSTPTGSDIPGFPGQIGDFVLFGCVGSTGGFPTFSLALSSASMDLDVCASVCTDRSFFGVHENDCYCGDAIDDATTSRVPINECSLVCPGDASEFCGGNRLLQRRQSVSNAILLTVYISLGGSTVTTTATTTSVFTTTVTGVSTTATQTVTAIYECFDGKCYVDSGNGITVWIFIAVAGADCDGQNVWVIEDCSCKGGKQYVQKFCSDGSCNGLTVYKPEQCDDWYNQDVVYVACDNTGKVVYQPWENNMGTPDHPVIANVPTCSGAGCPVPSTPATPTGGSSGSGSGSGGSSPSVVPVGAAGKQAVSGIAYVAALIAAFL